MDTFLDDLERHGGNVSMAIELNEKSHRTTRPPLLAVAYEIAAGPCLHLGLDLHGFRPS